MASGDAVVQVLNATPPGANVARIDIRVGGATPAESVMVRDYDAATKKYIDYLCKLEGYGGGGLTFTRPWSASTATAGVTRWGIAIRRMEDDEEDIDAAHTYDFNDIDDTAPSASGEVSYPTIGFSNGADMDNWAEGELAIVREYRNADHANDDMAGDAEAWGPPLGLET